jgi:hypothetical protein
VQKEEPNEAKWENQTGFTRKITIWPSYGCSPIGIPLGPSEDTFSGRRDIFKKKQASLFLHITVSTMERLFSPCSRLHDLLESQDRLWDNERNDFQNIKELNLNVSTEELLSDERGLAYADLLAVSQDRDTIAWMTPHTAVVDGIGRGDALLIRMQGMRSFYFQTDGKDSTDGKDVVASGRSSAALSEICNVVLRLLAVSTVHSVLLDNMGPSDNLAIKAPSLGHFMEQCQSLKTLSLVHLNSLQEDQIIRGQVSTSN